MIALLLLLVGLGASAVIAGCAPVPLIWIVLVWVSVLALAAIRARSDTGRAIWINVAAGLLAIGAAETFLQLYSQPDPQIEYRGTESHTAVDNILGYAPLKSKSIYEEKYVNGRLIWHTTYTIGEQGLRAVPLAVHPDRGSIVFFGCSYTFGEGLADEETMPFLVGKMAEGHYQVYNFGYGGYGPHQMLAELQAGVVEQRVREPPAVVIYTAITHHVARAAGRAPWDRHGPRYVLDGSGRVRYAGHFDDGLALPVPIRDVLEKSRLYRRIFGTQRAYSDADYELYLSIVAAARDAVAAKFPGAGFHVLLWDPPNDPAAGRIADGLERRGVTVHRVSDILPAFQTHVDEYRIFPPLDTHPNRHATEGLARYIGTALLALG